MWHSTADNSESHKSFRCRTTINPWRFLSPAECVSLWIDTEMQSYTACSKAGMPYYKTMSGFRLNFLIQVTLCCESWMCFSTSTVSNLPGELTAHSVIHSRRAVTMRRESLPLLCPHEFTWGWCAWFCLRSTAYIHQTHGSLTSASKALQLPENLTDSAKGWNPSTDC